MDHPVDQLTLRAAPIAARGLTQKDSIRGRAMNDQQAEGQTWDKRATRRDGGIRRRWVISQRRPVRNMAMAPQQRLKSLSAVVLEELRGRRPARTIVAGDRGERLRGSG
jgi:hypothetical protein